jgi:hypothetical protein
MFVSPFRKLSKASEKRWILVLLFALVLTFLAMRYFDAPLKNHVSTAGIVSFELAKELPQTERILNSWDAFAKTSAGMSMGLDFLFLIVYSVFIALLIHTLNERLWKHSKMYAIGIAMIWCVFLAAFFDSIENVALIQLLRGDLQQKWSSIAYYFAYLKFSLLALGILYVILNFVLSGFRKQ